MVNTHEAKYPLQTIGNLVAKERRSHVVRIPICYFSIKVLAHVDCSNIRKALTLYLEQIVNPDPPDHLSRER